MNSIQWGVFHQDNASPHTAVVAHRALQIFGILLWPARSLDLSPTEHVWDIIGRQLQHHPQPALTVPVLTHMWPRKPSGMGIRSWLALSRVRAQST
ncbi:uncharacterized protein TNCV_1135011 [Trichonephila clavipes]|nr:uncharacterized protein TNCV_1135011 [Trichonephila clavipes]